MKKIFLYIGTYTSNTKSKGIYLFHFDLDSGQLSDCIDSISTSNPSYITSSSS
ncbi:MAG: beta-propeller fold lactonase family protein, partial [Winogradskyella sp.]|uniref:beta-propeller fold lactonase family protein n=1 Tax=Winogradskyella sp. TaxID=1883156 RepID=UPI003443C78A|nr:beta-propeller fold lactonase family protein [Winogradskyella sp.]